MKHTRLLAGAAVSVLVLAACGSDSGGGSGGAATTPGRVPSRPIRDGQTSSRRVVCQGITRRSTTTTIR